MIDEKLKSIETFSDKKLISGFIFFTFSTHELNKTKNEINKKYNITKEQEEENKKTNNVDPCYAFI